MNDDRPSTNGSGVRSWLERVSHALLGEPRDREQLLDVLHDAQKRNLLDLDALAMIEGVLQVSEMQVRDIMIPRSQMVVLERDAPVEEVLSIIVRSGHSRFPVIGDSRDEVVGILLAKDMLWYYMEGERSGFNIREMLRPAAFIPESKRLNVLLREFRANHNHIAIVVDEYGGVAGMVTIEDVLEQIVGEIEDEHDIEDNANILRRSDDTFILKARTPVEDFNEFFETDFDDEQFDTIGGYVMQAFGHMPKRGEQVDIGSLRFSVVRADARRIHILQLRRIDDSAAEDDISSPT